MIIVPLQTFIVCVDYGDILAKTLRWNRIHFDHVVIVTTPTDRHAEVLAFKHGCWHYPTEAFYDDGADFNKWKALEEALDNFGRKGWICMIDADVVWPRSFPDFNPEIGNIYTPLRYNCAEMPDEIPSADQWDRYPLHPNQVEWAGYTQIFHADDAHLGKPPWHEQNWRHAGGADSFFQRKWPVENKLRPPFRCLHLGESGRNWCGRTDNVPDDVAKRRLARLRFYQESRKRHWGEDDPYIEERLD